MCLQVFIYWQLKRPRQSWKILRLHFPVAKLLLLNLYRRSCHLEVVLAVPPVTGTSILAALIHYAESN